jgi:hypothetical protein
VQGRGVRVNDWAVRSEREGRPSYVASLRYYSARSRLPGKRTSLELHRFSTRGEARRGESESEKSRRGGRGVEATSSSRLNQLICAGISLDDTLPDYSARYYREGHPQSTAHRFLEAQPKLISLSAPRFPLPRLLVSPAPSHREVYCRLQGFTPLTNPHSPLPLRREPSKTSLRPTLGAHLHPPTRRGMPSSWGSSSSWLLRPLLSRLRSSTVQPKSRRQLWVQERFGGAESAEERWFLVSR